MTFNILRKKALFSIKVKKNINYTFIMEITTQAMRTGKIEIARSL